MDRSLPLLPPHNEDAERAVLGAVLLDARHLDALSLEVGLRAEHFHTAAHAVIYQAMLDLQASDSTIDALTLAERLTESGALPTVGGAHAIEALTAWAPAAGSAREHGRIVRDNARLRDLLARTYEIQGSVLNRQGSAEELVEQAERRILELAQDERRNPIIAIADALDHSITKLEQRVQAKSPLTGTPSGFRDLDELTGGFQPGSLTVLAARPAMGKSALVSNFAENAALAGHTVLLFSLEMGEDELTQRFVASQARVHGDRLRKGRVEERDWPRILKACEELSRTSMFLDDSSDNGILEIRAKARRVHQNPQGPLGLIIIDYLQLMRPDERAANRVEQVGQMSRGLKTLARELHVPVIALSQLSRAVEQHAEKKPLLSDLRESGQIEADADLIMFIYREDANLPDSGRPGEADIIIAKHRHGPVGEITLTFQSQYPRFMNYAGERFG
jgi:replicative DNA helicase